jgi:MinD-like ATPase involved in chromosome partitioning or flagellar assembly
MSVGVLLAAGGAPWEPAAVRAVEGAGPQVVLLKRCLDLADLLASTGTGTASVAVVGADVVGLDAETVAVLHRAGLAVVVVGEAPAGRLERLGVDHRVDATAIGDLAHVLEGAAPPVGPPTADPIEPVESPGDGAVIAVWGPTGAPGRTTVAVGLATELAQRGHGTMLLDADPYGGAVAQHLGVLDQASGLLVAARRANAGELDRQRLADAARRIGDRLRVVTGLPRPDRWVEVRRAAYERLLDVAASLDPLVVVDVGFCLEEEADAFSPATGRNAMTLATLERADRVVAVGAADPVGLTRLVRGLHDLAELFPHLRPHVVVNRMRPSLGWPEPDVASTIAAVAPGAAITFLPEDRATVDRALMAGRSLTESGDSALRRGLSELAAGLVAQALSSR